MNINQKFLFWWASVLLLCACQCDCEPDGKSWHDIPVIRMGNHSQQELAIMSKNLRDSLEHRRSIKMQSSRLQSLERFDDGMFSDGIVADEKSQTFLEGDGNAVIELALICDMEFGAVFDFNEKAIKDYLMVFFWDSALRFKSLPSSNCGIGVF